MASEGVLNPKPTSLNHLLFRVETFFPAVGRRISFLVDSTGSVQTLRLGVLEEVLLLVSLFDLSKGYQRAVCEQFERLPACSDMVLVLRISTKDGGREGYRIDGLGLSHKRNCTIFGISRLSDLMAPAASALGALGSGGSRDRISGM